MTKPGLVKSRSPLPQPSWKTSVITPNAAPIESRLSSVETIASGMLRNVSTMISIVSSSTKPMTSASRPCCCWAKSRLSAAPPPTACSVVRAGRRAPAGTRSSRSSRSASFTRGSVSPYGMPRTITEVVPSAEVRTPRPEATKSPVATASSVS